MSEAFNAALLQLHKVEDSDQIIHMEHYYEVGEEKGLGNAWLRVYYVSTF